MKKGQSMLTGSEGAARSLASNTCRSSAAYGERMQKLRECSEEGERYYGK